MKVKGKSRILETVPEVDEDSINDGIEAQITEAEIIDLHDFITLELGIVERLPSLARYAEGMLYLEEAVTERFGIDHVEQAIDIVFELIENKDKAGGLGDEGDSYAPWRRDHLKQVWVRPCARPMQSKSHTASSETLRSSSTTFSSQKTFSETPSTSTDSFDTQRKAFENNTPRSVRPTLKRSTFSAESVHKTKDRLVLSSKNVFAKVIANRPGLGGRSKSDSEIPTTNS